MNKKNILVTGGYGFIGSNFINYLIDNYDEFNLINFDKQGIGSNPNNVKEPRNDKQVIHHFKWDISNSLLSKDSDLDLPFDYMFHFAAESHVDRSISDPSSFVDSNVKGTMNVLELARMIGVKRVILISTDEVYGSVSEPVKEDYVYNPSSVYSASKASAEMIAQSYKTTYDMDIIITRCSNNFGINQYEEKLIPKVINNAKNGVEIPIYDKGKQIREWTDVQEHIIDVIFVAEHAPSGEIYNVGRGYSTSNIDLVKNILKIMGKSKKLIKFIPNARLGHDFKYSIDTSKLQELRKKVSNDNYTDVSESPRTKQADKKVFLDKLEKYIKTFD